jgi:hypothetical protein
MVILEKTESLQSRPVESAAAGNLFSKRKQTPSQTSFSSGSIFAYGFDLSAAPRWNSMIASARSGCRPTIASRNKLGILYTDNTTINYTEYHVISGFEVTPKPAQHLCSFENELLPLPTLSVVRTKNDFYLMGSTNNEPTLFHIGRINNPRY